LGNQSITTRTEISKRFNVTKKVEKGERGYSTVNEKRLGEVTSPWLVSAFGSALFWGQLKVRKGIIECKKAAGGSQLSNVP